ncbi:hypothetical protein TNCV_4672221 [Trichonephila clavipes]|nr:hypothetical protein TNCV_4672221 [Trichonephila clavipes]
MVVSENDPQWCLRRLERTVGQRIENVTTDLRITDIVNSNAYMNASWKGLFSSMPSHKDTSTLNVLVFAAALKEPAILLVLVTACHAADEVTFSVRFLVVLKTEKEVLD